MQIPIVFASISPLISRGVIDNTAKDLIDLRLWCVDGREPLHFRMAGNCLRDIAGCRVEFTNNACCTHAADLPQPIQKLRQGDVRVTTGDITLSHRAPEKNNRGYTSNFLYLEFYAGEALRVLIETSDFRYDISLPQWTPTWADDSTQRLINMENLHRHIEYNVNHFRGPGISQMADMPACEWDNKLNRAEAYMAIYPTIKDKYAHEPGGYLSAAYVMDRTDFLGQEAAADEAALPPDLERLGKDWDVLDFFPQSDSDAVRAAMQHPMFGAASRMTALVQNHLINGNDRIRNSKEVGSFLSIYAGLVSHLLSTILLTRQENFSTETALARMRHIARRLRSLPLLCEGLPGNTPAVLTNAAQALLQHMHDFTETLPR